MRKAIAITLFIIGAVTVSIWGISQYVQPILPKTLNSSGVLFFAILVAVVGLMAGIKDILELVQIFLRPSRSRENEPIDSARRAPADYLKPANAKSQTSYWGTAPEIGQFYGRDSEYNFIRDHILGKGAKVIVVSGNGGIGKTTLVTNLAHNLIEAFDYIIWRSLQNQVSPQQLMKELINIIDRDVVPREKEEDDWLILKLTSVLRSKRCLVILDNIDSVLGSNEREVSWLEGFNIYGQMLHTLAQSDHESCFVITSREALPDSGRLVVNEKVVEIQLHGLDRDSCFKILADKGIRGNKISMDSLIDHFHNNPLALEMVSNVVRSDFGSNATYFLQSGTPFSWDLSSLLRDQVQRLNNIESLILFWTAASRNTITADFFHEHLIPAVTESEIDYALNILRKNSLIDYSTIKKEFSLRGYILDFITGELVANVCNELTSSGKTFDLNFLFHRIPLIQAQSPEDIKNEQIRTVLQPVIKQTLLAYGHPKPLVEHLLKIISEVRFTKTTTGYSIGNIINLLTQINYDLNGLDFSNVPVWQADLQGVTAQNMNFSNSDLASVTFSETIGNVHTVAFDSQGSHLAVGTSSGEIRIFRTVDLKQITTCAIKSDRIVWSVAFSPTNNLLATGSDDNICRIWDPATGECLHILQGHTGWIRTAVFNRAGDVLATAGDDSSIMLWDTKTWKNKAILRSHQRGVRDLAFSQKRDLLASCSDDGTIIVWDYVSGNILHQISPNVGRIRSVVISPSGQHVISGHKDGEIRIWNISNGELLGELKGHADQVRDLVFDPQTEELASCSNDKTIRIWNLETGTCEKVLLGHNSWIWSICYHPHSGLLLSGSDDQAFKLWEVKSAKCIRTMIGYIHKIWASAVSPNGTILATAGNLQEIILWNVQHNADTNGLLTQQTIKLRGHASWIGALAFNHKGTILASAGGDMHIRLWNTDGSPLGIMGKHDNWISGLVFTPDDKNLISSSSDRRIIIWDLDSKTIIGELTGHSNRVRTIAVDPHGKYLISGSEDKSIRVWDIQSRKCLQILENHTDWVRCIAYAPSGSYFATGGHDCNIMIWEINPSGEVKLVYKINTDFAQVISLAFNSDGTLLASGHSDNSIRIWDIQTGFQIHTLAKHGASLGTVMFYANTNILISTGYDGLVCFWEINKDQCALREVLSPERPYERMNITGAYGLTKEQITILKSLGAIG